MNWKPTTDTTALIGAMNSRSDLLLFDMASDALLESGSSMSLWDHFYLISCPVPRSRNFYYSGGEYESGSGEEVAYDFYQFFKSHGDGVWYTDFDVRTGWQEWLVSCGNGYMYGYSPDY